MNSINFSKSYHVRMLIERDIPLVLALCKTHSFMNIVRHL